VYVWAQDREKEHVHGLESMYVTKRASVCLCVRE
jgi:hypothetical protein